MPSKQTLSYIDHDGEASTVGLRLADASAGTFTALNTSMDTLVAAVDGVTLLNRTKDERSMSVAETTAALPANGFAQREIKWLVSYTDNVDPIGDGSFEIPGADLSLLVAGSEDMDVSGGAGAALVTALEANFKSRLGNAVSISKIIHVGRNI